MFTNQKSAGAPLKGLQNKYDGYECECNEQNVVSHACNYTYHDHISLKSALKEAKWINLSAPAV